MNFTKNSAIKRIGENNGINNNYKERRRTIYR